MALGVMAGLWPLRPRSLHAGFWAGERVMGVNQNISGLRRDGRSLAIATKATYTPASKRAGSRLLSNRAGSRSPKKRFQMQFLSLEPQLWQSNLSYQSDQNATTLLSNDINNLTWYDNDFFNILACRILLDIFIG